MLLGMCLAAMVLPPPLFAARPALSIHDVAIKEGRAEDPLFVSPLLRDYHLQPGSPARGRGMAEWTPATNVEGEPRSIPPNLGAY